MALPTIVVPKKLLKNKSALQGFFDNHQLERVNDAFCTVIGKVDVDIKLESEDKNRIALSGTVSCELELVCQRCLNSFSYPLVIGMRTMLVDEDSMVNEKTSFDDWPILGDELNLLNLIQDEILLGLPTIPTCETACSENDIMPSKGEKQLSERNPFEVLRQLKKDINNT